MDFSWILSWTTAFEDELNSIRTRPFQFETRLLAENEPGRWSPRTSRVESTAFIVNCSLNPLSRSLLARTLVALVSKRGGSFYNRIYRSTGGTTKHTYRGERDIVRLEIQSASKLRFTNEPSKWTLGIVIFESSLDCARSNWWLFLEVHEIMFFLTTFNVAIINVNNDLL